MTEINGYLLRLKGDATRTLGRLMLFDGLNPIATFTSLELPWRKNERNKSCIPTGKYEVVPHTSSKHGKCFLVKNVSGRDGILIHTLNFPNQTEGCIGIGMDFADIDKDGGIDIIRSREALNSLLKKAPKKFNLTIV